MSLYSPDLSGAMREGGDIIEIRTGSDSDFPKIQDFLDGLKDKNIPYLLRILSAHRTPGDMTDAAEAFPEVLLPHNIRGAIEKTNLNVKFSIAAAGGSAHIAGMTASETQTPVLALPVSSSSSGLIDSSFSMINMPPGIPNGFIPSNDVGLAMSRKLYNLQLDPSFNKVSVGIPTVRLGDDILKLINDLGLEIDETRNSPIYISPTNDSGFDNSKIQIMSISSGSSSTNINPVNALKLVQGDVKNKGIEGIYMGFHAGEIKLKNHILYAAQIIAMFNSDVRVKLDEYRKGLQSEVREKEERGFLNQILSPAKRALFDSGLWPKDKMITLERGDEQLESLGYELFYKGKNADLYLVPDSNPIQIIEFRTDRKSVFDIPLDLEIEGTGEVQTEISNLAAKFIEDLGGKTCYMELPGNIPESIKGRCKLVELCRPLTMIIDGREVGLEFIVRNRLTGSLYNKYYDKKKQVGLENPYGIKIPDGMDEHDAFPKPIFTPTTKEKNDVPVGANLVREQFPEEVSFILKVVERFTEFMYKRGYILEDGKIELFLNSLNQVVWGDEFFTPETFRFIKIENFNKKNKFKPEGKQIIRDIGERDGWKQKFEEFMDQNPDARILNISDIIDEETLRMILKSYNDILKAMAN